MPLKIVQASRLQDLQPYLFDELDRARAQLVEKGVEVIDLGVGDPDLQTPDGIVEVLAKAASDPVHQGYPPYRGIPELRQEIAKWYKRRYDVILDPETEVLVLMGSKDGLAHIPLAFVNYGDYALVPDPGYPVYQVATELAAGIAFKMPLLPTEDYLPKLASIPSNVANRAKLMFINYPNNPTSAAAGQDFYSEAVQFARKYNVIVVSDAAYSTLVYDDLKPQSLLQVAGAKQIGVEFQSCSKMFNMTGWRVGFAAGNADVIKALAKVKTNIDSGVFAAVQKAAAHALANDERYQKDILATYQRRRDLVSEIFQGSGLEFTKPLATFYFWMKVPGSESSAKFCKRLLNDGGVVATPGVGFGSYGENFFRLSLTAKDEQLREGCQRVVKVLQGEKVI